MKLFTNIFRGLGNNKKDMLLLQVNNLTIEKEQLKNKITGLERLAEHNYKVANDYGKQIEDLNIKLSEYKTSNILLEKEILKKDQLLEIKEKQRREVAGKVGGLEKSNNKLKEDNKEFKKKIKELEKELDKRYIIKTIPSGRTPKGQKIGIKSGKVQSKIIKEIKGDYSEIE